MKNIKIRRTIYHIRHNYMTTNNAVVLVALIIAASWVWGSVQAMERNYTLQKELGHKQRELKLTRLQTAKLRYEQNYYRSDEYKELAVRDKLGLVKPGEKVLILPPNTAESNSKNKRQQSSQKIVQPSNLQQWVNFLFGGSASTLQS